MLNDPANGIRSVRILKCDECGAVQHYWQDRYCIQCWSSELTEVRSAETATLLSWATYHTNYKLDDFVPIYTVGFVRLLEGLNTPCLLIGDVSTSAYQSEVRVIEVDSPQANLDQDAEGGLLAVVIPPT